MKDEGPFLLEWVAYHRLIGVNDILVFTNDCSDGTDQMLERICSVLKKLDRPIVLCAFGDHVPILPEVYADWGMPDGTTDYVIWRNWDSNGNAEPKTPKPIKPLACHQLGVEMLAASGVKLGKCHD